MTLELCSWAPQLSRLSTPTSDCVDCHQLQELTKTTRPSSWGPRGIHCWGGPESLYLKTIPLACFSTLPWNQLDVISPTSWPAASALVPVSTPHPLGSPTTRTGKQPPSPHDNVRHGRWLGWEQLQQMVDSLGHQPAQLWASQISLCQGFLISRLAVLQPDCHVVGDQPGHHRNSTMTIPTRRNRPSNGLFLDHWLNGPVLLQLRDLFPQTDHFPFEVWGRRGNLVHAHAELFLQWPTFLGLRRAPTSSVAFSREPWKLPLLPAGPNDLHAPRTPRIASLGLPELALSPVLGIAGEVSPEWQTLRSEHRNKQQVPPPTVGLELELQQ